MAGVLEFFFNDALDAAYRGDTLNNCSVDSSAPTYDIIISWSFLKYCHGGSIFFNKGTFVIFTVCVAMIWHEWKFIQPFRKWIPESAILLIMGLIIGILTKVASEGEIDFNDTTMFISIDWLKYAFLPMVILNASYELYHPQFFRQIYDILFLTIVGTLVNIGGTCLLLKLAVGVLGMPSDIKQETEAGIFTWSHFFLLSSALAAVDPVSVLSVFNEINTDTTIYYLLFGESTLNDGVTYALFGGIEKMIDHVPEDKWDPNESYPPQTIVCLVLSFVTGPMLAFLLAVIMVILSSLVCKISGPQLRFYLPYIATGFVWMGFYIADKLGFSAIIFTIVCAFGQIRYTFPNITFIGQKILRGMIKTNAIVLEIAIFALMGFNMAYIVNYEIIHSLIVLVIIVICRFVSVFGLFTIVNRWRKPETQVSRGWQTVLFVGGLRGALAFIMAKEAYENEEGKSTSLDRYLSHIILIIIFLTVILNGLLIKPLIYFFKLAKEPDMDSLDNIASKIKVLTDTGGETLSNIISGSESNAFGVRLGLLDRKLKKFF